MPDSPAQAPAPAARRFGRLELQELLGRSVHTMAWRVFDPRLQREFLAVMPRARAMSSEQLDLWQLVQSKLSRMQHPALVPLVESGHHEGWPYALYDQQEGQTLSPATPPRVWPARDAVLAAQGLGDALAMAHQAGMVHGDPQPYLVIKDGNGPARWIGMGVAFVADPSAHDAAGSPSAAVLAESDRLRVMRELARRDVLALGLLLYLTLTGQPPLEQPDTAKVIARMTPLGREVVRLPWTTGEPISEALRAIVNRATDRQPRQRYGSVRSLLHALDGWLKADDGGEDSLLELLLTRFAKVGMLPATPGAADRVARVVRLDRARTDEIASAVLGDVSLTLHALKNVNTAKERVGSLAGSGPVLTLRSAIALLGLDTIRRASISLKPWPGVLNPAAAHELSALIQSTQWAMRLAQELRVASWSADVVAVVTLLQQFGRLLIQYHFPDDMTQIRRLMQPSPPSEPDGKEEPGMSEQAAGFAVLGLDIETLACQVVRPWGLGEEVQQMMRRMPRDAPVHPPGSDDEYLRILASCAHETVEARRGPPAKWPGALAHIIKRYGRALELNQRRLVEALTAVQEPERATDRVITAPVV